MSDIGKEIVAQAKFCKELMTKLEKLINENIDRPSPYWGITNHSQMSNDIIRLRRELNELNKLLSSHN